MARRLRYRCLRREIDDAPRHLRIRGRDELVDLRSGELADLHRAHREIDVPFLQAIDGAPSVLDLDDIHIGQLPDALCGDRILVDDQHASPSFTYFARVSLDALSQLGRESCELLRSGRRSLGLTLPTELALLDRENDAPFLRATAGRFGEADSAQDRAVPRRRHEGVVHFDDVRNGVRRDDDHDGVGVGVVARRQRVHAGDAGELFDGQSEVDEIFPFDLHQRTYWSDAPCFLGQTWTNIVPSAKGEGTASLPSWASWVISALHVEHVGTVGSLPAHAWPPSLSCWPCANASAHASSSAASEFARRSSS
jgi:hypothetical protein